MLYCYMLQRILNNVIRDGNGPGRPRAGPENPGPRTLRAETGLMNSNDFSFKSPLCIVLWPLGSNMGIMCYL